MQHLKAGIIILGLIFLGSGLVQALEAKHTSQKTLDAGAIEFDPGKDSGFYYTIQKGDTLWDLSQKFYNSQWDWPGLWEMNKKIKNPHWIYPGNKIKIFLKKTAPAKPEPAIVSKPAPPVRIEPSFSYPPMDYTGFIRETAQESLGEILREKDGNLMMSVNDIIYIKPTAKGSLIPGKVYQVFVTQDIDEKINGKRFKGIKHRIKSEIKILEHKVTYVTAVIQHAIRDTNAGDQVMEFFHREPVLKVREPLEPIDSAIICSEDDNVLVNDNRIAFIDMGRNQNVQAGQIYTIAQELEPPYEQNSLKQALKKEKLPELPPIESGKLIVLHTEDIASTVMILSSQRDIHPGDMVN
ncbi:LysM peptidoglycan-binding domain-containing protein [Desulfospira joergensenii]|uniref:LysM peptidoglycan-binding domain-containing protein n=1 Tax=Desulfospira joergensenii TaxID=53329 RepID=UPI0003B5C227|nr:LysM peptidoglycan-binding domain-containing protein [Desulfospira joergensenii]